MTNVSQKLYLSRRVEKFHWTLIGFVHWGVNKIFCEFKFWQQFEKL